MYLLSRVQSVIRRAEMVPDPTLFGENSTTARRERSLEKRQKIHTDGELEENGGLGISQEVNQHWIPASNKEFQDSFQAVSPCLGQELNVCLTTEDKMLLDRNMQRTELLLTKRLPKDSIRTPRYPALLEMKIEATHNALFVVNKSCLKSETFGNRSECSLESGNKRTLGDYQTSTRIAQWA